MIRVNPVADGFAFVTVAVPDHWGGLMGKRRRAADWPDLLASGMAMPDFHLVTGFDNHPHLDFPASGPATGFRNGLLRPDPAAAFVSPGEADTLYVLADAISVDGQWRDEAPRRILARQVERLAAHGITCRAAPELEFYLFEGTYRQHHDAQHRLDRPIFHRNGDNDLLVSGLMSTATRQIEEHLQQAGMTVEQVQGEAGTGQVEINITPSGILSAADNAVAFKHIVKACAQRMALSATFMAKPLAGQPGSGGHVHLSFRSGAGTNALADADGFTAFGRGFIAGICDGTPELAVLHAPFANSYHRLQPDSFAPLLSDWDHGSREPMLRVIGTGADLRLEFRLPGADANPYLSYAAILAAGLSGVEKGLPLPLPREGAALPGDLTEAVVAFGASHLARAAFGEDVAHHMHRHAQHELAATRAAVTDWEVRRGFERA